MMNKERCADNIETNMADLDLSCQNDSCHNFGGNIDRCQEDCGYGYDSEQMEEMSRTRLEVNDVCYINGRYFIH